MSTHKIPLASVKTVLSCFNCVREGHVVKDCLRRPTYRSGVGRDTDNLFGSAGRDTQFRSGVGRDTNNWFGSVGRDTQFRSGVGRYAQCRGGVGRDTENFNTARNKGCARSGNDRRELSSNPTTARRNK